MPRTEIRNVTFNDAQLTFSPTSDLNEDGIVLFTGLENVDHPEMVRRVDFMSFFFAKKVRLRYSWVMKPFICGAATYG